MKIFLTGGAGYIGSHILRDFLTFGFELHVIDNFSTGAKKNIPPEISFTDLDISSETSENVLVNIFSGTNFDDAVIHLAGKKSVSESESLPDLFWKNNFGGTQNLLNAIGKSGLRRLIFASTAAVYGTENHVVDENSDIAPLSTYASVKLKEEKEIITASKKYKLDATIFRYFNVAGAGHADLIERKGDNLIPKILEAHKLQKSIGIFGNDYNTPDGTCVRDYVHVSDLSEAHKLVLSKSFNEGVKLFNLGSGLGYSVDEVVNEFNKFVSVNKHYLPRRLGDPDKLITKNERAHTVLGWTPNHTLQSIIKSVLQI